MRKTEGSLTIEAAIVLPIFIMGVVSVLYIIKIIFIQESMQYALNETASEFAHYAYIFEKSQIIPAQQEIYSQAAGKVDTAQDQLSQIITMAKSLHQAVEDTGDFFYEIDHKVMSPIIDMPEDVSLGEYIKAYGQHIKELKNQFVGYGETAYEGLAGIMNTVGLLTSNMGSTMVNGMLAEGLEWGNNYIGSQLALHILKRYIPSNDMNKWYIEGGYKGLDFSRSRYMLENDDIDLVLTYNVTIPIPFPGYKGITILQRAKVRAYTGSEGGLVPSNANHTKRNEEEVGDSVEDHDHEDDGRIVYVIEGRSVYHTYRRCVQKLSYPVTYLPEYKGKLCEVCTKGIDLSQLETVYQVPSEKGTNRYHVISPCSTHYSKHVVEKKRGEVEQLAQCKKCENIGKDLNGRWYTQ